MANTQAISVRFKQKSMAAVLDGASIKAALFFNTASLSGTTTSYSATGEASGTGYTAGGVVVSNGNAVATSGTTAYWTPSANIVFPSVTITTAFDCVQLYVSATNDCIGTWTIGSQTVTSGTITLTMPTNDASNALIRC